ncbi:metal-dependent hydrolase [Streptomyces fildesensis]|uniref:Metal-dependent hydrolase n=1 Tax=Streptomyces fildesensis TaxID=375757 RepID=A0ABW8CEF9_9ACTN
MTATEPDNLVLTPRDVQWDWTGLPMHYIDGDPFTTHFANVLNILLPEGEDWFITVFQQAVPMIKDDRLREDVIGFIGQEATHSASHQTVLTHFKKVGFDTSPYTDQLRWFFSKMLGDRELTGQKAQGWIIDRIAIIAAIEHVTAYLGDWILNADAIDRTDHNPAILDLYRWHGAEEVEHRAVAYDLFTHLDGRYRNRVRAHVIAFPVLVYWWVRGLRYLMAADPERIAGRDKPRFRDWFRASRKGVLPSPKSLVRLYFGYLRPGYHPSQYGSTTQAVAYLAASPAARAAHR